MSSYVLNEEKMFSDITDGIAIVINSETGIYYGLNGFGTIVFEALTNDVSKESLLNELKTLAGIPADIESKLDAFVKEMIDFELIVEGGNGDGTANIDATIAEEDKFELSVKEYNDAQELLLADPIHEVKEDEGWTGEKDSIGYSKEETREREEKVEN